MRSENRKPRTTIVAALLVAAALAAAPGVSDAAPARATTIATTIAAPTDPHIRYVGRWDKSDPAAFSTGRWPGAYLEVAFTGSSVQVALGAQGTDLEVSIDGAPFVVFEGAPGAVVDVTPTPLGPGQHTLVLVPQGDGSAGFDFAGLILDAGGETRPAEMPREVIEFVGDSITVGYGSSDMPTKGYPWRTAESIGAAHIQIAHGGICLVDGYTCTTVNTVGMVSAYSRQANVEVTPGSPWSFAEYIPTQIVVNLGTNDSIRGVPNDLFLSTYVQLLSTIRTAHPSAEIFVLRPFGGFKGPQARSAVDARRAAGDANVHFVDTTGWLTSSDYLDTLHPNDAGVDKIVARLTPILRGCSPWGIDLAQCASYSASTQWSAQQSAALAFDGNLATNWQAAQYSPFADQWLQIDFGTATTFNQVLLAEYGGRTTGFRIEYWNGSSWATAYTGTAIGSAAAPSTHSFAAVTASKARIRYTSGTSTPILYEFGVRNSGTGYATLKSWNFATDGNAEGWTALQLSGTVSNRVFDLVATGSDAQLTSPGGLAIGTPSVHRLVRIRMQNLSGGTAGRVYFTTNADPVWSEAKSVPFAVVAHSGYTDYVIDMASNPLWAGVIRQLRIDPLNPSGSGHALRIDYIRVTS